MSFRRMHLPGIALVLCALAVSTSSAAIISTLHQGADFPSAAEFQPFDPHNPATPTGGERTLHTTRNLTQTFQLASDVNVQEIDLMYVRGSTAQPTGRVRIFPVADTQSLNITSDFNDAVTNGFLLDETYTLPVGHSDNTERTLRLLLSNPVNLPASTSPAGYAINLSVPDGTSEIFTWRFGDPGTGGGNGWYADGRVFYDDFVSSGTTEGRRDGLFALNGNVTSPAIPEPAVLTLLAIGMAGFSLTRRR